MGHDVAAESRPGLDQPVFGIQRKLCTVGGDAGAKFCRYAGGQGTAFRRAAHQKDIRVFPADRICQQIGITVGPEIPGVFPDIDAGKPVGGEFVSAVFRLVMDQDQAVFQTAFRCQGVALSDQFPRDGREADAVRFSVN